MTNVKRGILAGMAAAVVLGIWGMMLMPVRGAGDGATMGSVVRGGSVVMVADFHPAGNGVIDDAVTLQRAVNLTPSGGTLVLEAGRTYAVSRAVDCRGKTIHIDGSGSTLLMTGGSYPTNKGLLFGAVVRNGPRVGEPVFDFDDPGNRIRPTVAFTGKVEKGATSLTLPEGEWPVKAGDYVSLHLGTCPTDKTLPDVQFITKVTEVDGAVMHFDAPVPREVHGEHQAVFQLLALGDDCSVENLNVDWSEKAVPIGAINVVLARNFVARNITGRFCIAVGTYDVQNVRVDGIRGVAVHTQPWSGRIFSATATQGFDVRNADVTQQGSFSIVMLEGRTLDGTFENIRIHTVSGPGAWGGGWLFMDGAQNVAVRGVTLEASTGARAILDSDGTGNGSNHTGVSFENVRVNVPLEGCDMREIKSGRIDGVELGDLQTWQYTVPLPEHPGGVISLAKGVIRRLYVKVPAGVKSMTFRPNQAGPTQKPTPGEWYPLVDGLCEYRWNDPKVAGVGDCGVDYAPGTKGEIQVRAEVFACGQKEPD